MPEDSIETGYEQLDKELRELFDFCEGDGAQRLRQAVEEHSLDKQTLAAIIPDEALRVAGLLVSPLLYEGLVQNVNPAARPALESARRLTKEKLNSAFEDPLVRARSCELAAQVSGMGKPSPLEDSTNVIAGVSSLQTWLGAAPRLKPAVRFGFTNPTGRLLLDSLLDWDDILYLANALTNVLSKQMSEGQELAKLGQVKVTDTIKLARHIREISKNLCTIGSLALVYGITPAPAEGPDDTAQPPSR